MWLPNRDLHGDGHCRNPVGMETKVAGFPSGWENVVGFRGDRTKLCGFLAGMWLYGAHVATKMVFKLLKDVCSDFIDTILYYQLTDNIA